MGELIDKAKGKVRQLKADITGNESERIKGKAEEAKGRAKGAFEDLKHAVKKGIEAEKEVPDQP